MRTFRPTWSGLRRMRMTFPPQLLRTQKSSEEPVAKRLKSRFLGCAQQGDPTLNLEASKPRNLETSKPRNPPSSHRLPPDTRFPVFPVIHLASRQPSVESFCRLRLE